MSQCSEFELNIQPYFSPRTAALSRSQETSVSFAFSFSKCGPHCCRAHYKHHLQRRGLQLGSIRFKEKLFCIIQVSHSSTEMWAAFKRQALQMRTYENPFLQPRWPLSSPLTPTTKSQCGIYANLSNTEKPETQVSMENEAKS